MLLHELHDPKQRMIDAALAAMHRLVTSKGNKQSIGGYAFTISKSFNGFSPRELERLYREKYSVNEVSKEEFDAIQNGYVDIEFDKKWWPLNDDYPLIKHIGKAIGATSWTSWGKVGVPWSETEMIGGAGTYMLKGDFGHILLDAAKSFRPEQILMAQISTSNRGGGVGVKVMNAIKSYADQKGLPITIYKVTNKKFFDKFEWLTKTGEDTYEYKLNESVNEGYKLQLERDADMMVLNITDTKTGKRTEVRGKSGYETDGYDPEDKLHQLLDKIGRSASVSDMMNGDVVTINPNHPKAAGAKTATTTAFNESLDNPYPFKLTGPNDAQEFSAVAQTPNGVLRMDFETTDYDNFGIDFVVGKSMGKTEAGDEFRVFATVVAMMKKWINTVGIEHVESFDFGANKDEHASDGRAKLYARFAKQLASQLGWKLEQSTTKDGGTAFFRLVNPKPIPREQEYWDALEENFADGKVKGKSRPGRVKRSGASCNGSVTELRKKAKNSSGEKAKMYHWCANMKAGRQK